MKRKQIIKSAYKFVDKNSNVILTIFTIVGIGAVVYTTSKATLKTKEDLDILKESKEPDEKPTKKEMAKVIVRDCWPAAVTTTCTIITTVCNGVKNGKRIRKATLAYEFFRDGYYTYREKTREKFGDAADSEIQEEILHDKKESTFTPLSIKDTGEGNVLFMESKTGHLLRASQNYVRDCEKEFNQMIRGEDWLSFNNWLNILGIEMLDEDFGDLLGFREIYDKDAVNVYFEYGKKVLPNGETPTLIMYKDRLCTEEDRECIGY